MWSEPPIKRTHSSRATSCRSAHRHERSYPAAAKPALMIFIGACDDLLGRLAARSVWPTARCPSACRGAC